MKKVIITGDSDESLKIAKILAENYAFTHDLVFAEEGISSIKLPSPFSLTPPPMSWLNPPKIKLTEEFEKPKSKYHK